jgi:hypothetical protein
MAAKGSRVPLAGELIIGVAQKLGIDVVNEPQYLWIAEEAARDAVEIYWKEYINENGEVMYYNEQTKKLQKVHPTIDKYMQYYHKTKAFTKHVTQPKEAVDPVSAKLGAVVADIQTRANRGLPPSTPENLEQLCTLLKVNTLEEFYIARSVKTTLEAYLEKGFNLATLLDDLEKPMRWLRTVQHRQVKADVIQQATQIIMCVECEDRSAVIKDCVWGDYFCQDCFNATHATGKRRGHITEDIEQLVCAVCDREPATSMCVQDGLFYCDQCFVSSKAARPELHNHLKRVINGLVCLECEHYNATVLCEDCVDLFCTECFIKLHQRGRRRQHVHLTIDNTGQVYRGGFLVPPEERESLIKMARATKQDDPEIAFKDDNFRTYLYNLKTKQITPFEAIGDDGAGAFNNTN